MTILLYLFIDNIMNNVLLRKKNSLHKTSCYKDANKTFTNSVMCITIHKEKFKKYMHCICNYKS